MHFHVITGLTAAIALICLVTDRQKAAAAVPTQFRRILPHVQVVTTPAVAVCLYGPAAGMLAVTRSSLWAHLLDVLSYHGWHADVYVHTYDPWSEAAPRSMACAGNASMSSEVGDVSMAGTAPWRLLQPIQEVVDKDGPASPSHADDKEARLAASLAAVTRMWQAKAVGAGQHRAIIYAR